MDEKTLELADHVMKDLIELYAHQTGKEYEYKRVEEKNEKTA